MLMSLLEHQWYILRVSSGREQSIAKSIEVYKQRDVEVDRAINEVYVPVQTITKIKKNIKTYKTKSIFSGYVLINMLNTKKAIETVKNISGVIGFVTADGKPVPLSKDDFKKMTMSAKEQIEKSDTEIRYEIGQQVKIIDGPFASFVGEIENIDYVKNRLRVAVAIFGQLTPVDLELNQVSLNCDGE